MKKIVCCFLLAFIIISCGKEKNEESSCSSNNWEFSYISSPLNNFFFKQGSYWIFQNDSTKLLDSLYITSTRSGCEAVYLYQGYGYNWEYYTIDYASYPKNEQYFDVIEGDMMQRNRHPSQYPSGQGWILYSNDTVCYWHPIHIDSIKISNFTFYQVQLSHDYFSTDNRADIYTANGIGIVRKVVYDGKGQQVWNLVRWKIIK